MNIDDLRRELEEQSLPEPLDPEILVGRAETRERGVRRTRRLLVVGAAVVVVTLGLTTAVRSGWLGSGAQSYVAGQPSGTPTGQVTSVAASAPAPTSSAVVITTSPRGGEATVTPVGPIPATGVIPADPYVATGEKPAVRSIPDNTWVEVVTGVWVATWKTNIIEVVGDRPTKTPQAACAASDGTFGCRGTTHNTNVVPGFTNVQGGGLSNTTAFYLSAFSGSPMSATATTSDGTAYWGTCWRLAGVPGWTFAFWVVPFLPTVTTITVGPSAQVTTDPFPKSPTLIIYDGSGKVTGRIDPH